MKNIEPEQEQCCPYCQTVYVFTTNDLVNEEKNEIIYEFDWECIFCGFIGAMNLKVYH